jgi:hypothetical protein
MNLASLWSYNANTLILYLAWRGIIEVNFGRGPKWDWKNHGSAHQERLTCLVAVCVHK